MVERSDTTGNDSPPQTTHPGRGARAQGPFRAEARRLIRQIGRIGPFSASSRGYTRPLVRIVGYGEGGARNESTRNSNRTPLCRVPPLFAHPSPLTIRHRTTVNPPDPMN